MATYSFPALGFDPAPGDPDAIDAVARECERCAQDLRADADHLQRLTQHVDWQGDAADAFAAHPTQLHDDLLRASDARGGTGYALASYADALRQAQLDARRLEQEAAEAKATTDRHAAEVDRLAQSISAAPADASTADQAAQQEAARRLSDNAQDDYQLAVALARRIHEAQQEAGDRAASRIRALSEAPYQEPGLLSRMADSVTDWVGRHADLLREVSNALKTVSAVAGLLSFVPALTPIFGPIAALTAGGALVVDAALVATGHGSWKALAVDAALMVLPGAGRVASRAMMSARGGGFVAADATRAMQLSRSQRPGTVATLVTRNLGTSTFRAAAGAREELHPRLLEALDRVPKKIQPAYHGKCAEINAIDGALKDGARVKGSVMRTMRVRAISRADHGTSHPPCQSCEHVLHDLGIEFRG